MTEQKKIYIMDALGELEDTFIAEAAEYVKGKAGWKYWRELGAAAACVAAVVMTVTTLQYLPIGRTAESTGAAENTSPNSGKEAFVTESAVTAESSTAEGEEDVTGTPELIENKPVGDVTGEGVGQQTSGVNDKFENSENDRVLAYSQGIEWEIVEENQENYDGVGNTENGSTEARTECWESTEQPGTITTQPGITESIQTSSCVRWLSAEEIFAQGNDIFMGTVTDMQVYRVTGKVNEYFTVATVEVKDSIRGEMENGEVCRIYLPLAEINGMVVTNSLVENLMKLEIGSNAIFMPKTATADTGLGKQNAGEWLCYADFADYYFSEGMRYLFLETGDGVSYAADVYEVPGEDVTLTDVAQYIREMLAE